MLPRPVPSAEEEGGSGEDGDDGADDDGLGIEPIAGLALVQHVLQGADGKHQEAHAHPIGLDVGNRPARQIPDREEKGEHADGDVDVEHHAPGIGLGEIAAERGTDHRRDHDAEPENGERLPVPLAREGVEQDPLAQGNERRAEHALGQAEQHHAFEIPRHAAKGGRQDKARDREQQKPSPPKPAGEIAGERHHHGGGHDVRGQDPGDLIGRGGKGAEHVGDRDVHDRYVEHFEHRGEHHGDDKRDRRTFGVNLGETRARRHGRGFALAAPVPGAPGRGHCAP